MENNAAAICELGLEDISAAEIKELTGSECKKDEGIVTFNTGYDELANLCYRAQSIKRIFLLVSQGKFTGIESLRKDFELPELGDFSSIVVECEKIGEHEFKSVDAAEHMGSLIIDKLKKLKIKTEVSFRNPNVKFFIFINQNNYYFGVDFAGFDISKREYKIFTHAASLKGTIGYGIIRIADYSEAKYLLSCFGKSGIVPIEAALFASKKAVNFYRKDKFIFWNYKYFKGKDASIYFKDEIKDNNIRLKEINSDLRNVSAGKKNAKIAGVDKLIDFARMDIDWLDIKFKERGVDIIIAQPIASELSQIKELFRQAEYILAEGGVLVIVTSAKMMLEQKGFNVKEERILKRGSNIIQIQIFKRSL